MTVPSLATAPTPDAVAAAADLPDLLPPVKMRRGIPGFMRRHPAIAIGGALVLAMVLIALFAPYLGTLDPTALAPVRRTREPSAAFWFGTDMLGGDIYSRVLNGARVSLTVGFSVAMLASLAGLVIGLVSGFVRWSDAIIMRVTPRSRRWPSLRPSEPTRRAPRPTEPQPPRPERHRPRKPGEVPSIHHRRSARPRPATIEFGRARNPRVVVLSTGRIPWGGSPRCST